MEVITAINFASNETFRFILVNQDDHSNGDSGFFFMAESIEAFPFKMKAVQKIGSIKPRK